MTVDRGIHLKMALPQARPDGEGASTLGQPRQEAGAQARERFREALSGQPGAQDAPPGAPPRPTADGRPADSPFALFSGLQHAPLDLPGEDEPAAGDLPEVFRQVQELLNALMVRDEAGHKQVRMTLADDVLPGVTVVVEEAQGRLCIAFTCTVEASRLRLNRELPTRAPEMAQRLAREVLLSCRTDDDEDPCLLEVLAGPQTTETP